MNRCPKRCKNPPLPAGMTVEAASLHPRFKYYLIPGAQCEHEDEHEGPHRNGGLIWHDPLLVLVDGKPVPPLTSAELERLQRIGMTPPPADHVVSGSSV